MTRKDVTDAIVAILVMASVFVITAALAGLWFGMAWRFVWITAP